MRRGFISQRTKQSSKGGIVRSNWLRAIAVVCALFLAAPCLKSPEAWAMDVVKSAAAMAQQALKAYEGGDHARAAQLYASAWRTNPAESAYLYAAARAEHVGGAMEMADEHYRAYLALTGIPDALRAKATAYLKEVALARAQTKAHAADQAVRAEDPGLAGPLYKAAFELCPERPEWLFKAAVCAQLTGDNTQAVAGFRDYLKRAAPDAPDRREAELRLSRLSGAAIPPRTDPEAKPAVVTPPPAAKPNETPPVATPSAAVVKPAENAPVVGVETPQPAQRPSSLARLWPWVATGGAVVLGVSALGLYLSQSADAAQLTKDLAVTDAAGHITGVTPEDAKSRNSSIGTQKTVSAVLAGASVAAAGVAVWLWLRPVSSTAAVVPDPANNGVVLVGRF